MNVKEYRLKKGYTQEYMANILNISRTSYCKKENGKRGFKVKEILILQKILGTSFEELFQTDKGELN